MIEFTGATVPLWTIAGTLVAGCVMLGKILLNHERRITWLEFRNGKRSTSHG